MKIVLPLLMAGALLMGADADEKNYQAALSLIDGKEYQEAMVKLGAEIQSMSSRADAAMYWSAYAANKLGDRTAALKQLAALQAKFSTSKWANDARALQLEINQASGKKISPEEQSDEELKALFVLGQSGDPKAQELIGKIAKGNSSPELQKLAIHNLGIGGKRNGAILEDVYKSASELSVKKEILHSFMIMGDKERLLGLAKAEKNEDLKSTSIHWLGVSGGREMLVQLYSSEASLKLKKDIIHGLFIGGGAKELVQIARSEKDIQIKKEAVRYLSMMNSKESADFMAELLK
ncbi:MAG: hypothetical protein NTW74_21710 [Acidobacteria bacterium]|nr:hypothetical protein [Acidobacteriota bacterium]